jgi:hypothetical protein
MKTFRNANFTSRNYECINVVCCQAVSIEDAKLAIPTANWVECNESEISSRRMDHLWSQGGVKLFGWM